MYLEDQGPGDGDITIPVDGAEYTAEANRDLDGDGIDEAVTIMTDDGFVAYVDSDADGRADVMRHVDTDGVVTGQARFDATAGTWVAEAPEQNTGDPRPAGESMVLHAPDGPHEIGPPTEDTNHDGRPDTSIVATESGTMLATDVDGDGRADQLVRITSDGAVTVSHHTGSGEWTVVDRGRLDEQGRFASEGAELTDDAAWDLGPPPGAEAGGGGGPAQEPTAGQESTPAAEPEPAEERRAARETPPAQEQSAGQDPRTGQDSAPGQDPAAGERGRASGAVTGESHETPGGATGENRDTPGGGPDVRGAQPGAPPR
ncbi:hypothetical protein GCM10027174_10570 [Salinifilum aidingensis]